MVLTQVYLEVNNRHQMLIKLFMISPLMYLDKKYLVYLSSIVRIMTQMVIYGIWVPSVLVSIQVHGIWLMSGFLNKILMLVSLNVQPLCLGGIMVSKHWLKVSIQQLLTISNQVFQIVVQCCYHQVKKIHFPYSSLH